jgi:hypothetical protein
VQAKQTESETALLKAHDQFSAERQQLLERNNALQQQIETDRVLVEKLHRGLAEAKREAEARVSILESALDAAKHRQVQLSEEHKLEVATMQKETQKLRLRVSYKRSRA